MKKLLLIVGLIFVLTSIYSQVNKDIAIIGLIVNESGEALIAANIVGCKGTFRIGGTYTDMNGIFELTTKEDSLEISYLGYETIKLSVETVQQDLFIVMKKTSIGLPELVVPGYAIGKGARRGCGWDTKQKIEIAERIVRSKITYEIYPNPSPNRVLIKIPGQEDGKISLLTSNGVELYKENMKGSKLEIDLSRYSSGSYYLKYEEQEIVEILGPIIKISN